MRSQIRIFAAGLAILLLTAWSPGAGAARAEVDPAFIASGLRTAIADITRGKREQQVFFLLNSLLHYMRDPMYGRFNYRYAEADLRNLKPRVAFSQGTHVIHSKASAPGVVHAYARAFTAIEFFVPELTGKGQPNDQVFLDNFVITYVMDGSDGKLGEFTKKWIAPGDSLKFDFEGSGNVAWVAAAVGAPDHAVGAVELQIRVYEPEIADSLQNEYYYAIRQVKSAVDSVFDTSRKSRTLSFLQDAFNEVSRLLPPEPEPTAAPTPTPTPTTPAPDRLAGAEIDSMIRKLEYVRFLMGGDSADRARALQELDYLINELKAIK